MKKLLTLIFFTVSLASCSSDSGTSSDNSVLLQKIIREDEDGSTSTATYVYNGKKMKTISFGGNEQRFYYSGNLIDKVESYLNGDQISLHTFEYDASQKLAQYKLESPGIGRTERYTYVYNDDNTISVNYYRSFDDGPETLKTEKYFTDNDGEIVKIERYSTTTTATTLYTYDNKNNPFKNVIGFDKMLNIVGLGTKHNTLTTYETGFDGAIIHQEKTITYSASDYPVTMQYADSNDVEHYYY